MFLLTCQFIFGSEWDARIFLIVTPRFFRELWLYLLVDGLLHIS